MNYISKNKLILKSWGASKLILREKLIDLNVYIGKSERQTKINELSISLQKQSKPNESRSKKILNMKE